MRYLIFHSLSYINKNKITSSLLCPSFPSASVSVHNNKENDECEKVQPTKSPHYDEDRFLFDCQAKKNGKTIQYLLKKYFFILKFDFNETKCNCN